MSHRSPARPSTSNATGGSRVSSLSSALSSSFTLWHLTVSVGAASALLVYRLSCRRQRRRDDVEAASARSIWATPTKTLNGRTSRVSSTSPKSTAPMNARPTPKFSLSPTGAVVGDGNDDDAASAVASPAATTTTAAATMVTPKKAHSRTATPKTDDHNTSISSGSSSSNSNNNTSSGDTGANADFVVDAGNDEAFMEVLVVSMKTLQKTSVTTGARERAVWKALQQPVVTTSLRHSTRLALAQWLILYHTINTITATSSRRYLAALADQRRDMELCWTALLLGDSKGGNADDDVDEQQRQMQTQATNLLKLEVAQRLQDADRMTAAYDTLRAHERMMNREELYVMFTTAPLLGRWRDCQTYGARIAQANGGSMHAFHTAALTRPDLPDYSVLYELSAAEAEAASTRLVSTQHADNLLWAELNVECLRMRLDDVTCAESASRAARVRASLENEFTDSWRDIPPEDSTKVHRVVRCGGIAQMLSISNISIPLVGPATKNRIVLRGYVDLAKKEDVVVEEQEAASPRRGRGSLHSPVPKPPVSKTRAPIAITRQTEEYRLTRKAATADGSPSSSSQVAEPDEWKGVYILTQELSSGGGSGGDAASVSTICITFDVELKLVR